MKRLALSVAIALGLFAASAGIAQAEQYGGSGYGGQSAYGHNHGGHSHSSPSYSGQSAYGSGYGNYGQYSSGYGNTAPHYHSPSVHTDRVYHQTYSHWTPFRGAHSHGHYDAVPHYTPGQWHY